MRLTLLLVILLNGSALANEMSAEKRSAIEELMEITQALAMADHAKRQMLNLMSQSSKKKVPEAVIEIIDSQMDVSVLKEDMMLIYAAHFTHEEILQLNEFYRSTLGQRLLETQPAIVSESMAAGQRWAQRVSPKIEAALREHGYMDHD